MHKFDLIVIGTGAAASAAAFKCRKAGWSVAIIDSRPFGGTCQLRGCDPKKVLVGVGALIDAVRRMNRKGLESEAAHIDWAEAMLFKRTFTDPATHDKRVLVGLGARSSGATVSAEIRWPNGFIQRLSGIEINRYHAIAEPSSSISQPKKF